MRKKNHLIKRHIACIGAICLFIFMQVVLKISCPILYVLGVPCPTCGVSRAMYSLLRWDINLYVYYHPLAFPLVVSVFLMLHLKQFKRRRLVLSYALIVLLLNIIVYILRFDTLGSL